MGGSWRISSQAGGVLNNAWTDLNGSVVPTATQCCGAVTIFYGSGSDFWKFMVPVPVPTFEKVMVPVPVPTFEKLRFRFRFQLQFQLRIWTMKSKFFQKNFGNFFPFLLSKLFYKEKVYKFQQIFCKMWMKKILDEGNQKHNFVSNSVFGTVIITVPVPTF